MQDNAAETQGDQVADRPQFALRFISGKYQGGEFPLKMDREVVIGRSSDLDMVLVEDMVSRKHARISTTNGQVIIQDMGSTNGTFVNGEKIKRVRLREGDRILIGTSIIKLISIDESSADSVAGPPALPPDGEPRPAASSSGGRRTTSATRSMAGTIDEIPLPDLLQLLSTSKKSGVLEIQNQGNVGRIFMRQGQIYFATINDSTEVAPRKAVYRMLVWETGAFELHPPDEKAFENELSEPTEGLLMEAMRQLDELRRIEPDLPAPTATLRLAKPLAKPLRDMTPEQLDLLQAVHDYGVVNRIVDTSPRADLDTYTTLLELIQQKVILPPDADEPV